MLTSIVETKVRVKYNSCRTSGLQGAFQPHNDGKLISLSPVRKMRPVTWFDSASDARISGWTLSLACAMQVPSIVLCRAVKFLSGSGNDLPRRAGARLLLIKDCYLLYTIGAVE